MTLKTRIIPVVLMKGRQAVKGKGFGWQRPVGQLAMTVRVYSSRQVDELALLSVSGDAPDVGVVSGFADACFAPLLVGGGIRELDQIRELLAHGADAVAINTAAVETPDLITQASKRIGSQSVTVSIDVKHDTVWTRSGQEDTGYDPVAWATMAERLGAGQILLNSIERDGTMEGYDIDLVAKVSAAVDIPVVACGGAGSYDHMLAALLAGAHGVAAGAMWSFTDATPLEAARYLKAKGIPTRCH